MFVSGGSSSQEEEEGFVGLTGEMEVAGIPVESERAREDGRSGVDDGGTAESPLIGKRSTSKSSEDELLQQHHQQQHEGMGGPSRLNYSPENEDAQISANMDEVLHALDPHSDDHHPQEPEVHEDPYHQHTSTMDDGESLFINPKRVIPRLEISSSEESMDAGLSKKPKLELLNNMKKEPLYPMHQISTTPTFGNPANFYGNFGGPTLNGFPGIFTPTNQENSNISSNTGSLGNASINNGQHMINHKIQQHHQLQQQQGASSTGKANKKGTATTTTTKDKDPAKTKKEKNMAKKCRHPGCTKFYRSGSRFCVAHGGGRRCQMPGCPKSAQGTTNFCSAHGGGRRCQFPAGCGKGARGKSDYCIAHGQQIARERERLANGEPPSIGNIHPAASAVAAASLVNTNTMVGTSIQNQLNEYMMDPQRSPLNPMSSESSSDQQQHQMQQRQQPQQQQQQQQQEAASSRKAGKNTKPRRGRGGGANASKKAIATNISTTPTGHTNPHVPFPIATDFPFFHYKMGNIISPTGANTPTRPFHDSDPLLPSFIDGSGPGSNIPISSNTPTHGGIGSSSGNMYYGIPSPSNQQSPSNGGGGHPYDSNRLRRDDDGTVFLLNSFLRPEYQ